jgi:hypothetical protein
MNPAFIGNIVDKVAGLGKELASKITSGKDKDQANKEFVDSVGHIIEDQLKVASTLISNDQKGNWLQRSWRPILMLGFGFIVMYSKFIAPAFGLPNTELEHDFWTLLEIGIGGYVIGRSAEKITEKAANVVGQNLLKKKDRKI